MRCIHFCFMYMFHSMWGYTAHISPILKHTIHLHSSISSVIRKGEEERKNKYVTFFMTYFPMLFQENPSKKYIVYFSGYACNSEKEGKFSVVLLHFIYNIKWEQGKKPIPRVWTYKITFLWFSKKKKKAWKLKRNFYIFM